MSAPMNGELVWVRSGGATTLGLYLPPATFSSLQGCTRARVSNLSIPIWSKVPSYPVVYRHPISVTRKQSAVVAGPVFAILAASGEGSFVGSKANFRDILRTARNRKVFMYVLPTRSATDRSIWSGYVRTGYHSWTRIPCPLPEAIYNRIPNRNLERVPEAMAAKVRIRANHIPMFNPDYFNKAKIYEVVREANLHKYLPDTTRTFSINDMRMMLSKHHALYLKPTGGSIGHGMIRIVRENGRYRIFVLKSGRCECFTAAGFADVWNQVRRHRLPGQYIIQEAIPLIEWNGHPCDFRVLLQKQAGSWLIVGTGVRVSGANSITTHVPNGGSIASATRVLSQTFGDAAADVESRLNHMTISCADAIDAHYRAELGEMSMDIGVDKEGNLWFFEANAKPMKFDEKDIRQRSLNGIVTHLEELRRGGRVPRK